MTPIGTGFLIQTESNHTVLVTAKHVVADDTGPIKKDLSYRINLEGDKSSTLKDDQLISIGGGNWFLSEVADIALRFIANIKGSDILTIPQDMFLKKEYVQSGTPCFILGFPMGLRSEKYATPILRNAIVALKNTDHLIIDGFAFPGNSGGPVVYMPAHQIGGLH